MNDEGVVLPRKTRRQRSVKEWNPGWSESAKERTERYRREEEEWAAKNGPVIVKQKGKTND